MDIWQPYLDKIENPEQRKIVLDLLQQVLALVPEAQPAISYNLPALKYKGKGLFAAAANKNHLGIYPFSGSVVEQAAPNLPNAEGFSKGAIRYTYNQLPTPEEIALIVQLRLQQIG